MYSFVSVHMPLHVGAARGPSLPAVRPGPTGPGRTNLNTGGDPADQPWRGTRPTGNSLWAKGPDLPSSGAAARGNVPLGAGTATG